MKRTVKYCSALQIMPGLKCLDDSRRVYEKMQQAGFMWDSQTEEWVDTSNLHADPPTDLLRVRVWADSRLVEQLADVVALELGKYFVLDERSVVYPCRPPKQSESRVYLTFRQKNK